jgi:glucan phosphoethanolaminetransferase (alkaline phosphatase superfamily)
MNVVSLSPGGLTLNKRKTLAALVAMQCVYVIFIVFWLFFAAMSAMMFDSPGTEDNTWLFLLYLIIWMYPVGLLVGALGGWICYRREKYAAAMWWNAIPLVWVLPIGSLLVYAMIG